MRAIGVSLLVGALLMFGGYCQAQELTFPKTERQIVDALTLKDGQIEYNGQTYVSEHGKAKPIASNDTEASRICNRRVELIRTDAM
jgi:hypothetical protein